jgi:glc operon protein GlcG
MRIGILAGIALLLLPLPGVGAAPAQAQAITLEQAKTAMDAAEAEARKNKWNLAIVIVDADGIPIYLRRMEPATAKNYEIAMGKVRTALTSGMHTVDYAAALKAGKTKEIPNGITFEGGYLMRRGGQVVGAMSASGARGAEDAQVVRAGMAAIGIQP